MTTNPFNPAPIEPYNIGPNPDGITLGQLRYAAEHGDQRAALTLKQLDRKPTDSRKVDPGGLKRGEALYNKHKQPGVKYDSPTL